MFYILNSGINSLFLPSAVDEQINGNLIWSEDLFSTLVAQNSTLQQHNFAPVATSDLSVCITVLSHSLSLPLFLSPYHTHPVAYVLLKGSAPLYNTVLTLEGGPGLKCDLGPWCANSGVLIAAGQ